MTTLSTLCNYGKTRIPVHKCKFVTKSLKQVYKWFHQKSLMSSKFVLKSIRVTRYHATKQQLRVLNALCQWAFKHSCCTLTGTNQGYHAVTIAMYMNELIKRVDPKHRPLHQFFKEEFAEPLGK